MREDKNNQGSAQLLHDYNDATKYIAFLYSL